MSKTNNQLYGLMFVVVFSTLFYLIQCYNFNFVKDSPLIKNGDHRSGPIIIELIDHNGENGVYFTSPMNNIKNILNMAGIDSSYIQNKNILDDKVANGMQVKIGMDRNIKLGKMNASTRITLNIPINVNNATIEDLIRIPGIGGKQASRIVDLRNRIGKFQRIDDLKLIDGIKEKKILFLKKYLILADEKSVN